VGILTCACACACEWMRACRAGDVAFDEQRRMLSCCKDASGRPLVTCV
jgi:hypothetical protein